ncbi:MAG: hypothetical protein RLY76_139, partial [Actinomycetota bacterium]
ADFFAGRFAEAFFFAATTSPSNELIKPDCYEISLPATSGKLTISHPAKTVEFVGQFFEARYRDGLLHLFLLGSSQR